jgi:DNA-binding HxlR family transcriptional regulator
MLTRRRTRVTPPICPLTTCMRVLGGRWTPNVLWYLRETPRRFSELKSDLVGISAKTLSVRLQKLEKDGVVRRDVRPTSPPTVEYELTALGRRLIPAIEAIVSVGEELKRLRVVT